MSGHGWLGTLPFTCACPACQIPLGESDDQTLRCPQCGRAAQLKDGVLHFAGSQEAPTGGTSRGGFERLVQLAAEHGKLWPAIEAFLADPGASDVERSIAERLALPNRAAFRLLMRGGPGPVLVVSRGWSGAMALELAGHGATVCVAGDSLAHLRFLNALCQECHPGVRLIYVNPREHLPMADGSFDTVFCQGPLIPRLSAASGGARRSDQAALAELNRVLKPSGQLALAVRNRWSWQVRNELVSPTQAGTGRRADGSPSTSDTAAERGSGYSLSRWRKSLASVGHRATTAHVLYPEQETPSYTLPMGYGGVPRRAWNEVCQNQFAPLNRPGFKQRLKDVAARVARWRIARHFGPGFCILSGRTECNEETSFVNRLLQERVGPDFRAAMLLVRLSNCVVVPSVDRHTNRLVYLKLPLTLYGHASLTRHWNLLERLSKSPAPVAPAPQPLLNGDFEKQPFYVESAVPGMGGGRARAPLNDLVHRAAVVLIEMHRRTKVDGSAEAADRWRRRIGLLNSHPLIQGSSRFDVLERQFTARLADLPCSVLAHNDYHLGNVIFDQRLQVSGVLDWDLADTAGMPVMDVLHLLIASALRRGRAEKQAVVRRLIEGGFPAESRLFGEYCQRLGTNADMRWWMVLYLGTQIWRLSIQAGYWPAHTTMWNRIAEQARQLVDLAADI